MLVIDYKNFVSDDATSIDLSVFILFSFNLFRLDIAIIDVYKVLLVDDPVGVLTLVDDLQHILETFPDLLSFYIS